MVEQFSGTGSVIDVLIHAFHNEILEFLGETIGHCDFWILEEFPVLLGLLLPPFLEEGGLPEGQEVAYGPDAPYVRLEAVPVLQHDLRGFVGIGAIALAFYNDAVRSALYVVQVAREPEVEDLVHHLPVLRGLPHDVRDLQVQVRDVQGVHVLEALQDVAHDILDQLLALPDVGLRYAHVQVLGEQEQVPLFGGGLRAVGHLRAGRLHYVRVLQGPRDALLLRHVPQDRPLHYEAAVLALVEEHGGHRVHLDRRVPPVRLYSGEGLVSFRRLVVLVRLLHRLRNERFQICVYSHGFRINFLKIFSRYHKNGHPNNQHAQNRCQ